MSVNFQVCADLEIGSTYEKLQEQGGDALALIFGLQKSIQEDVYGYNFEQLQEKLKDLKAFIDWNEEALRDESREFASALTGIHTYPDCWKPWKSKHKEALERKLSDLTEEELKELRMEWIDQLHFFVNIGLSIGMTPQMTTDYYVAKNKRNIERQQKPGGY